MNLLFSHDSETFPQEGHEVGTYKIDKLKATVATSSHPLLASHSRQSRRCNNAADI